jgi:multidrug transporter EmrE-like cation transporter
MFATGLFNSTALVFGLSLAVLDMIAFPIVKLASIGKLVSAWLVFPVLLYSMGPLILYKSLQFERLAIMNILWDTMSSIGITLICVYYFKETLTTTKMIGLVLSIISIGLMAYEG